MAEPAPEYPEPRLYSREFKLEAVRLSETSGKSLAQLARELGIPDGVLYRWRRQWREQPEAAFPGKGHQKPGWKKSIGAYGGNWSGSSRSAIF